MTKGDSAFIDTNVLLRAMFRSFPEHGICLNSIETRWEDDVELWVSRQVLRELLVQMTHPRTFVTPLTDEQIKSRITLVLTLFRVADDTQKTTRELLRIRDTYPVSGKQIHDANIVATMLENSISTLLTLNVADFKRYEDRITVVSPAIG